ncbi:hypothetical protein H0I76_05265 [Limibaculum sp. M0105]|uniref:Molybdopterin-guanine dinucleotide biosynthesis protein A n=1 Tax=Thermohalobaculum xanthum TaxID=2753746 RepID=A0A8J7M5E6_9RHOB|nr:hypothetical protein [Thermohalobaculum xanthum]MBK0398588.1 hypothetical protein [Thermohalobaculum xanthum]
MTRLATCLLAAAFLAAALPAAAQEKDDYYYPPIGSEEVFERDLTGTPPAERAIRVNFITQITKAQLESPKIPRFAIFAKGGEAEHMIIVALDDEVFATLYRARAVMAQLTANARSTDFFQRTNLATSATWFDLAKILGFRDIVISDGRTWSHRVVLK